MKAETDLHRRRSRRPRETAEFLRRVFIDATIDLLQEMPFGDITTRVVADRVGRGRSTIYEQFGSMEELFIAACHELIDRSLASLGSSPKIASGRQIANDVNYLHELGLRPRLVAWLLANGVDPELVRPPEHGVGRLSSQHLADSGVSERTAENFATMVALLTDASAIIGPVYDLDEAKIMDGVALLGWMQDKLPEMERDLGWGSVAPSHVE